MSKLRSSSSMVAVLNLLTPEGVEEHSQGDLELETDVKLAVGAEEFSEEKKFLDKANKAKIIPFKRTFGVAQEEDLEADSLVEKDIKVEEEESSSVFLIQERIKSRVSRKKLLEGDARKLYQAGANLEFCEPVNEGDESEAMDPKGVLFNKKHP